MNSAEWLASIFAGSQKKPADEIPIKPGPSTPWMDWALAHEGEKEVAGSEDNPFIMSLYKYGNYKASHDETPWCAVCVCAALELSGYKDSNRADAISYKKYGEACEEKYGAIIVLEHPNGKHHVTFFLRRIDKDHIECLGGNQSNTLRRSVYNVTGGKHDKVIACRWPVKAA